MRHGIKKKLFRFGTKHGLSVRDVADELGIPVSTYRDWEYGKLIRGEPYVKIAELFEVSLDELLRDQPLGKSKFLTALEGIRIELDQAIKIARTL
jgi:transcriptional regulator with XRE-family HTH domain